MNKRTTGISLLLCYQQKTGFHSTGTCLLAIPGNVHLQCCCNGTVIVILLPLTVNNTVTKLCSPAKSGLREWRDVIILAPPHSKIACVTGNRLV